MLPKIALPLVAALPASAALRVRGIFGSHMVIQCDTAVEIRGCEREA
jgi:hypothetical protein